MVGGRRQALGRDALVVADEQIRRLVVAFA